MRAPLATGPPPRCRPQNQRTATASLRQDRAVAALTTTILLEDHHGFDDSDSTSDRCKSPGNGLEAAARSTARP